MTQISECKDTIINRHSIDVEVKVNKSINHLVRVQKNLNKLSME